MASFDIYVTFKEPEIYKRGRKDKSKSRLKFSALEATK